MSGYAYVQIRPMTDQPIRVICRPCGLEQPEPRWAYALEAAKTHNQQQHSGRITA